jgi:hypothetical protein
LRISTFLFDCTFWVFEENKFFDKTRGTGCTVQLT